MIDPPVDVIVGYYLKMVIDKGITDNEWLNYFLDTKDVYCVKPSSHFNTRDPRILHEGRYVCAFVPSYCDDTSKTDGCESGCWRIMGRDKVIKCKETGKTLGLKRVLKFCETEEEPRSVFRFWEREKRRVKDKRVWVMEEYRHATKWRHFCVICKIRLLNPDPLHFLLSNHLRGY